MQDVKQKTLKKHNAPYIVEIVGLAGVGKTTMTRLMSKRDDRMAIGPELELRKVGQIPIFAAQMRSLFPLLLQRSPTSRWFRWDEIKSMAYLNGWPSVLKKQAANQNLTILLDHGPIFKLATLNAFGPKILKESGAETWWSKMLEQWAHTLDMVVWLDAPDAILSDRINNRAQKHLLKGKSQQEAYRFLERYRESYEQILASLKVYNSFILFQVDTSSNSIDYVLDDVLHLLNNHLYEKSN